MTLKPTLVAMPLTALLAGCQTTGSTSTMPATADYLAPVASESTVSYVDRAPQELAALATLNSPTVSPPLTISAESLELADQVVSQQQHDLWELTRRNMQLGGYRAHPRVVKQLDFYNQYPGHMKKVAENAQRYYYYVLQEVLKRDMPAEIALLPAIESLYNPQAYSSGKAAGIWQFIPSTAVYFGMQVGGDYDDRRDIITSTDKALNYLQQLNRRFSGDWLLTLAAYNGGGGTVSNAIKRNIKQGKPTDYWSLELPREPRNYVPKLLAISALVESPSQYNTRLPSIANTPYFQVVETSQSIVFAKAAKVMGISRKELALLNPGPKREIIPSGGPSRILVPVAGAELLTASLADAQAEQLLAVDWIDYRIKPGDSLGLIAQRHGVTTQAIRSANNMTGSRIRAGKTLRIPALGLAQNSEASSADEHRLHTVSNGDTLWDIAREHNVTVKQLLALNQELRSNATLRVGKTLKVPGKSEG